MSSKWQCRIGSSPSRFDALLTKGRLSGNERKIWIRKQDIENFRESDSLKNQRIS